MRNVAFASSAKIEWNLKNANLSPINRSLFLIYCWMAFYIWLLKMLFEFTHSVLTAFRVSNNIEFCISSQTEILSL